jgi:ribosomal protein S18 acetylase RimI-like enzyme
MSTIKIRPYEPLDRPLVLQALIELQNFEVPLHDTRLPGEATMEAYLYRMLRALEQGDGRILIAELNGEFVGFVGCLVVEDDAVQETADSNRYGYIKDIFVADRHRGGGIAQQLLATAEQHLARTGVTRLRINVLTNNLKARRAYERYGFEQYEILYEKRVRHRDPPAREGRGAS